MSIIYIDGKYLEVKPQILEAMAPGTFNAQGVFETMLGVGGHVMDVSLHLQRLQKGLKILRIKPPLLKRSVLTEVLRRNRLKLARVRLMVWRDGKQVHMMAAAIPYQPPAEKPFKVCLIKTDHAAHKHLSDVKSLDYRLFVNAHTQAKQQGFDEALLLNREGYIFEASRGNIFWVKDHILYTPPLSSGCLNGITRRQVMLQTRRMKMICREKNLTPAVLKTADMAFLTNSLMGLKEIKIA